MLIPKKRGFNFKECGVCGGVLGRRWVTRQGVKLCGRHYIGTGLKSGDRIVVDGKVKAVATNDKQRNYQLLLGNYG